MDVYALAGTDGRRTRIGCGKSCRSWGEIGEQKLRIYVYCLRVSLEASILFAGYRSCSAAVALQQRVSAKIPPQQNAPFR